MTLHRKNGILVTAVCCVVEEHQVGDAVVGLIVPVFLKVTENLFIDGIKGGIGCLLGWKVDECLNVGSGRPALRWQI